MLKRRMVQGVLHRTQRGLGVVAAVQIVAGAHFQNHRFSAMSGFL